MTLSEPIRGITVTLNGSTVSFQCEGDSVPDATWDGPKGIVDGAPRPKVNLPERYFDTGFAEAVALALEEAVP